MEAILPFKIKNEQIFFDSALKVGYNEMEILKFIYVVQQSDLDIFPIMHDERINVLLYGWELCEDYKQNLNPNEWELPEEMETVIKLLVPWSMDIWFSKEWDKSKYFLKTALIHCLNRARDLLMRMPDMMQINWDFLLLYNLKPWNVLYLKNLTVHKEKTLENGAQSIETEELPATDEDVAYVKLEQLPIIVLRLVKLFDQSAIDMVKTLCMRVIAAWNKIHHTELETSGSRRPYIPPEDKRCLLLICHIYLMAVYESDDVKGYVIDNMINNIRFYYQGFQNSTPFHVMDNFEYTPARFIALTTFHLRVQKRDFFDFFIWNKYDTSLVNLFGVVSQAYKSYLLGNLLMELNNMNEDDFAANIPLYKRLMNSYVNEREKSEIFLLNELTKLEHQKYAHNVIQTVKNITDYESKICKGNRMSNIGNYENSDDTVAPLAGTKATEDNSLKVKGDEIKEEPIDEDVELEEKRVKESELRLDPVFQNLPNNESMLYYVYDVLARKDYKGWHFAKLVLLVKLIGHEQNMIETWRYHPGLTTDFMLNLDEKLSHHYVDLAKIFKEHPFLEQEFWLTAFYLNPIPELFEIIKRLGMRNNRKRTDEHTKLILSVDNIDAKYGLLSSTIDVKELAAMTNTDDPVTDYDPLFAALHSLRVPDSLIKDMLTAIFLPRNRGFAWSVDWVILRSRCKIIMHNPLEKKRIVDLNMAEANERLKYLIIDYEKYKNRPQLDYGTIEQGYENLMSGGDFDKDTSEEEEEEEEEDFEDDEDVYENKNRGRGRTSAAARKKEEEERVEDDNSQEDDPFLSGKRRTRARTAATLASFLFQTLPRSSRRKRNEKQDEETKPEDEKLEKLSAENDRSSDSKSPIRATETLAPSELTRGICDQKDNTDDKGLLKNLKECLKERPAFLNTTEGFRNLIDIWNVDKTDLQSIDENCVSLMESTTALQIAVKLKLLNKEINPISCDEKEYIDDKEMLIHNAEYAIQKECETEHQQTPQIIENTTNLNRNTVPMELDHCEEIVASDGSEGASFASSIKPEETLVDKVDSGSGEHIKMGNIVEQSPESDFKIPVETAMEKVSEPRHKANETSRIQDTEENISENLNSDMPIAARKDSSEVGELNTEANSKRNSFSNDLEMLEKSIQNDDVNKQNETITEKEQEEYCKELIETSRREQETEHAPNELDDKENKLKEQQTRQAENVANEAHEENKIGNGNESVKERDVYIETETGSKSNQPDDKTSTDNKDLQGNKPQQTNTTDNKLSVEVVTQNQGSDNESKTKELVAEADIEYKSHEENKAETIGKPEDDAKTSCKIDTETKTEESKTHESLNILGEELDNGSNKNTEKDEIVELLKSSTEVKIKDSPTKLAGNESEKLISKHVEESQTEDTQTTDAMEMNTSCTKLLETLKHMDDITKSETQNIAAELGRNPNTSKLEESGKEDIEAATCTSKLEKNNESTTDLVETNDSFQEQNSSKVPQKEKDLEISEGNLSDDKDTLDLSENQESSIVLHYSTSEELNVTKETIDEIQTETKFRKKPEDANTDKQELLSTDSEKAAETSEDPAKHKAVGDTKIEIGPADERQTEATESEKAAKALNNKTIESTKAGEGSSIQTMSETNRNNENLPVVLLDDNTLDSMKSMEQEESTDSETRELKSLCLRRNVKVLLSQLRPCELSNLRQPKVKVQRTSYEKYLLEYRPKRRRLEEKLYLEFDESSNSNISYGANSSSSEAYRPPRTKRKIPVKRHVLRQTRTSESDNDSMNSEDIKLSAIISKERKRRLSPSSSSRSSAAKRVTGPKSARKRGPKSTRKTTGPKSVKQNLVVTPRSASGLKLRISNAEHNRQTIGPMSQRVREIAQNEVIQLSSTSSDEFAWNEMPVIPEEVIDIDDNPLFEEEIII